ncbi:hypothetical protein H4R99_001125 [Coemansia sp. RSA 1722]|nr:hypothetical protein LPJ57_000465 [Coemansia sp. RSA 486]KAJ2227751.1 hypothetical protein IWW45_006897 [Coemansia sp. RSA 485]KAJ2605471.1 hypothetical protein H4R99_001125 [Coemansia sp. RSA 1722]
MGNSGAERTPADISTPAAVVAIQAREPAKVPSLCEGLLHEENCAVCLEEFSVGEKVRQLPCRHYFHVLCIDPWLGKRSATCPLCNYDVGAAFGKSSSNTADDTEARSGDLPTLSQS